MVIAVFFFKAALAVGAVLTTFVLITDAIFSVIVTYIFLQPMLEVLRAAGGNIHTEASRRLERTKWWNFAGVLVTVLSSTVLYVNLVAQFMLSFLHQHYLGRSVWGNPFTFGLAMDSNLNTLGMLLLCGMFKNVSLPSPLTIASRLGSKVAVAAPEEPKGESYLVQGETPAELPVPEKPADAGAGD
jgi:hypothetical protein